MDEHQDIHIGPQTLNDDLVADGIDPQALLAEFLANAAKGIDGLNDDTYAALAKQGLEKDFVKELEADFKDGIAKLNAQTQQQDFKLFELAGGPDRLWDALQWGRKTLPMDEQVAFDAITRGSDFAAKADAVRDLLDRFDSATTQTRAA